MSLVAQGHVTVVQARPRRAAPVTRVRQVAEGPTSTATSLAKLMSDVAQGDMVAFRTVYDRLAPLAFGVALKVLRDPHQAEEVAQDVLLEVWVKASRFDPARGTLPVWVTTITRRRSIDRVRSTVASRRRETLWARPESDPDPVPDAVETHLRDQEVRGALKCLTELQRRSVELAFYEGLTARQISDHLGVPVGTIKSRIRDGLIRLGTSLAV